MKGFIQVRKDAAPFLLSLNAIASVSPSEKTSTRIILLVTDKSGEPEKIFVQPGFDEVIKLIEEAS